MLSNETTFGWPFLELRGNEVEPKYAPAVILSANSSWYIYNFRLSTIRYLTSNGYSVYCMAPKDEYSDRLCHAGCIFVPIQMDGSGLNPFKDFMLVMKYVQLIARVRPLVVLNFTIKNNVYGALAAGLMRSKSVSNVSGLGTAFIRGGVVGRVVRFLYRISQPLAYKVFCQNPDDAKLLVSERLVSKAKLSILPGSGVDLNRFGPHLRNKREPGDVFKFLYVGRMLADKGLRELIQAISVINSQGVECELLLCGFLDSNNVSAITDEELKTWLKIPGVIWLGASDSVEHVYAMADCVVLPSYREGMPRTLLEAGAMGLPSVATDVPGCRTIISEGLNGWLCRSRDSISLRETLKRVLRADKATLQTMGLNARRLVEDEYSEELVVKAVAGLMAEIET